MVLFMLRNDDLDSISVFIPHSDQGIGYEAVLLEARYEDVRANLIEFRTAAETDMGMKSLTVDLDGLGVKLLPASDRTAGAWQFDMAIEEEGETVARYDLADAFASGLHSGFFTPIDIDTQERGDILERFSDEYKGILEILEKIVDSPEYFVYIAQAQVIRKDKEDRKLGRRVRKLISR